MPRSARSSAGRQVLGLAARFSGQLLAEELAAFTRLDQAGAEFAAAGRSRLAVRARKVPDVAALATDGPLRVTLGGVCDGLLTRARPVLLDLASASAGIAVLAIGRELAVCESTLAPRYAGVAAAGEDAAFAAAAQVAAAALAGYAAREATVRFGWLRAAAGQLHLAGQHGESRAELTARLFLPDPVRLPGCGGRGVWWGAVADLQGLAREVSVGLSNRVRTAGMAGFNAAHDDVAAVTVR